MILKITKLNIYLVQWLLVKRKSYGVAFIPNFVPIELCWFKTVFLLLLKSLLQYTTSQKLYSILHRYILNEFLTADHSCTMIKKLINQKIKKIIKLRPNWSIFEKTLMKFCSPYLYASFWHFLSPNW